MFLPCQHKRLVYAPFSTGRVTVDDGCLYIDCFTNNWLVVAWRREGQGGDYAKHMSSARLSLSSKD